MLIDSRLEFSSNQNLTSSGALSTNIVDLTQLTRQIGVGTPLFVHFNVTVAASLTSAIFTVETDTATNFSTAQIVLAYRSILEAVLVIGYKFTMMVPTDGMLRYLGVRYALTGGSQTIKMDAFASHSLMQNSTESHADGIAGIT